MGLSEVQGPSPEGVLSCQGETLQARLGSTIFAVGAALIFAKKGMAGSDRLPFCQCSDAAAVIICSSWKRVLVKKKFLP